MPLATDPHAALPLTLDLEDFKGDFSFDALFGSLVDELLPAFGGDDAAGPPPPPVLGAAPPVFPAVDELLGLFKHSCKELVDLRRQIDKRLQNLKKEVASQDAKHRKTLGELEKGVDGLFDSFARLDSRISSVGQTAAKIGDHLQSAESQRETASQTIDLIKYLMEFNSTPGDLMELSPLFSDDSRVAEAASIAQKLRSFAEEDVGRHGVTSAVGSANASRGLEVAVANLQEYCNELENRLLARFDAASQRRELSTMAECAKILSKFNRGTSAMQHYVATRPMFIDVEVMNTDIQVVLGDEGPQVDSSSIADGLSALYKEIADTVRKEATTIMAVFPSPNEVMSILVQRVLEQRVTAILDRLLIKPSLASLPPIEEGGLLQYLRVLAVAYDKTKELAKDLQSVGCGDLDIEGLTESIYVAHKDEYTEFEQASLRQLYQSKMAELRAEAKQQSESTGTIGRSKGASLTTSPQQQISVTVVTEFVRWNEEAISRCTLLFSQPTTVAANVRSIFACLLDQVSQYLTEGLDRARESLNEAAALRDRFVIGTSVSRRVAAAAASAAEAAAAAGESSFRSFMIAVQRCVSSVAILQQYFSNTISRLLLPADGAHPSACEDMGSAVSVVEAAAHKGLLQCIDTVMSETKEQFIMVVQTDNFPVAKSILTSDMWAVISQSEDHQGRNKFVIPATCPGVSRVQIVEKLNYVTTPLHQQSTSLRKGRSLPELEERAIDSIDLPRSTTPPAAKKPDISFGSTSDIHLKKKLTKRSIPLVDTEVRRSTRLRAQKGGFMHNPGTNNHQLTEAKTPPFLSSKIIKNLCLDYCKVPPEDVTDDRLAKVPTKDKRYDEKESEKERIRKT